MSRTNRRKISEEIGPGASEDIANNILAHVELPDDAKIAGYWPLRSEADIIPALTKLDQQGNQCLLPATGERHSPLVFREWSPGDKLQMSNFGVQEPTDDKPIHVPDILLVPLLAFDSTGHRLGYGGGYYDRTIAALRKEGVMSAGIAFSGQQVDALPNEKHDQHLDMVVTESGVVRFA